VPGIVMYKLLELSDLEMFQQIGVFQQWTETLAWAGIKIAILPLFGLSITLASAYRLAKFNIDTEQQSFFKGLPTPANTLLIISLPLIFKFQDNDAINEIILNKCIILCLVLLIVLQFAAIPLIILLYIGMSVLDNMTSKELK